VCRLVALNCVEVDARCLERLIAGDRKRVLSRLGQFCCQYLTLASITCRRATGNGLAIAIKEQTQDRKPSFNSRHFSRDEAAL